MGKRHLDMESRHSNLKAVWSGLRPGYTTQFDIDRNRICSLTSTGNPSHIHWEPRQGIDNVSQQATVVGTIDLGMTGHCRRMFENRIDSQLSNGMHVWDMGLGCTTMAS